MWVDKVASRDGKCKRDIQKSKDKTRMSFHKTIVKGYGVFYLSSGDVEDVLKREGYLLGCQRYELFIRIFYFA